MSQSIKSDRISESTIARMAGNIAAGLAGENWNQCEGNDPRTVQWVVSVARRIAAEVERTRPAKSDGVRKGTPDD